MGYYNGYQPTGDVGVMMGGINRGFLHLAQSDLDCALAGADEKLGDGFGAKMHFYLTSMIAAQDDYQASNAFSPLSVLGPWDIIGWLTNVANSKVTCVKSLQKFSQNVGRIGRYESPGG